MVSSEGNSHEVKKRTRKAERRGTERKRVQEKEILREREAERKTDRERGGGMANERTKTWRKWETDIETKGEPESDLEG